MWIYSSLQHHQRTPNTHTCLSPYLPFSTLSFCLVLSVIYLLSSAREPVCRSCSHDFSLLTLTEDPLRAEVRREDNTRVEGLVGEGRGQRAAGPTAHARVARRNVRCKLRILAPVRRTPDLGPHRARDYTMEVGRRRKVVHGQTRLPQPGHRGGDVRREGGD